MITGVPCADSGSHGAGGAFRRTTTEVSSRGADSATDRKTRQDRVGLRCRPGDDAGRHLRPDLVQSQHELGDDPEVAAASAERPEEVVVLGAGGAPHRPVGSHDLDLLEIVDRPSESTGQVAEPSTEREPGHAGRGDEAERRGQTVFLRRPIDIAEVAARADPHTPRLDLDLHLVHRRHVEGDTAVTQRQAGDVVPAALDRQLELVVADELDGSHDVPHGRRPHHECRPLRDHPVPDGRRFDKRLVVRVDQGAAQIGRQRLEGCSRDIPGLARQTGDLHSCHVTLPSM